MIECFPISCLVDHQKVQNIIIIIEPKNVLSKIGEININKAIYLQWYTTQNGLRNQPKQLELHKKHVRMLQNLRANTKWQILNFLT